jgi:hypothetical protein
MYSKESKNNISSHCCFGAILVYYLLKIAKTRSSKPYSDSLTLLRQNGPESIQSENLENEGYQNFLGILPLTELLSTGST